MMTWQIAGVAALAFALASGPAGADGPAARQDEVGDGQEQVIAPPDAIRRVGRLIGAEVGGAGGDEKIALVRDLVWDGHGRPLYLLLSPGTGNAGPVFIPVPARAATLARVNDDSWLVQIDAEGDRIEAVPRVGVDEVEALLDPTRRDAIEVHFPEGDALGPAEAGDEPDPMLIRATELLGHPVLGGEGPVARIEEILAGNNHQASYVVLGVGDDVRLVPVPFSALTIRREPGGGPVIIRIDTDQARLANAPSLEGDWHKMLNTSFVEAVHNVHAAQGDARTP